MKTTYPPARSPSSRSLLLITYLPRRSAATVGGRQACRAVLPQRRDEGGSPLTVLLFAFCFFALCSAPKSFGVSPAPDGGYSGGNTAEGSNALNSLTSGIHNTATGFQALFKNTTGNSNMATGSLALFNNTSGVQNMGIGFTALYANTTGSNNAAVGSAAMHSNTTGGQNTSIGSNSMYNSTTGSFNSAVGYQALYSNTTASYNTATGYQALYSNTSGTVNTAIGAGALYSNTSGGYNVATGYYALYSNTTNYANVATGNYALYSNITGGGNMANGNYALYSNTAGNDNIALGDSAGFDLTTGSGNIDIGSVGVAGESHTMRIGDSNLTRAFIAGIRGVTTGNANAVPVLIDSAGQLGTVSSSRRFKKEIKPMEQSSETILALKPVTFHYKSDNTGAPQFGLIAEEVAEVNPDLVVRDEKGDIYTVRYDAVNAMLLNEFLKEHHKVETLEAAVAQQQQAIAILTSQMQKLSVQLSGRGSHESLIMDESNHRTTSEQ